MNHVHAARRAIRIDASPLISAAYLELFQLIPGSLSAAPTSFQLGVTDEPRTLREK